MVYDGSPAADAGIQIGDRITNINESKIDSIDDAITAVNNLAPGNKVVVKLTRGGESKELTLTAARLPTNIPGDLPSARTAPPSATDATEKAAAGETRDLKLPEFPNKCRVYVPASHEAGQPQAAILWLQGSERHQARRHHPRLAIDLRPRRRHADRSLSLPERTNGNGPSSNTCAASPSVSSRNTKSIRIAWSSTAKARAEQSPGRSRSPAATCSAASPHRRRRFPRPLRVPPNEPSQRLAIFAALPASKDSAAPISLGLRKFADAGYNVATITTTSATGQLSDDERNQLARWIDTLDRF